MVQMDYANSAAPKEVEMIMATAEKQVEPLKKGSEDGKYEKFFDAMAKVWHVADEFNMSKDVPFTSFLMFGPQSAGKTTLTERILGFPVAVVKSGVGTTRPMVLTTRRSKQQTFRVKGAQDEKFKETKKEAIMGWVSDQMKATGEKISGDKIYIEVSGPDYMNRRFVDLPGFQLNDAVGKGMGSRKAILDLLHKEMDDPYAVVVCVEEAKTDFHGSTLVKAIEEVFGKDFAGKPNLAKRFVFAFNKSDEWLKAGGVTEQSYVERVFPYVEGCGLVPILVGASIDPGNASLRKARNEGGQAGLESSLFESSAKEYSEAPDREAKLYREWFTGLPMDKHLEDCLTRKLLGFQTLLGSVDAMVVNRDILNIDRIGQQLRHTLEATTQKKYDLKRKQQILAGADMKTTLDESNEVVKDLLQYLSEIALTNAGAVPVAALAASDVTQIDEYGNTAYMEEMEFAFGERKGTVVPSSHQAFKQGGYYNPELSYNREDRTVADVAKADLDNWKTRILETAAQLKNPSIHPSMGGISYLKMELITGGLYERALAVWSSAVYRSLVPSEDDLKRLANAAGLNTMMSDPQGGDLMKATRLAEMYITRLTPAIGYLCQKMEFLLLKNFDTAWRTLLRYPQNRSFVEAVGGDTFMVEVRLQFQKAVRERAKLSYIRCFSDLRCEVSKLIPYSMDSAAVTGMLFAYPEIAKEISNTKTGYEAIIKEHISNLFPKGFSKQLLQGIEAGMNLLVTAGSIDPLVLAGLQIFKTVFSAAKFLRKNEREAPVDSAGKEVLCEDRDERLLGFSVALYSHFVPRFIATIDARMRSGLWATLTETRLKSELEKSFVDSVRKRADCKVDEFAGQIQDLEKQETSLSEAIGLVMNIDKSDFPVTVAAVVAPIRKSLDTAVDYDDFLYAQFEESETDSSVKENYTPDTTKPTNGRRKKTDSEPWTNSSE